MKAAEHKSYNNGIECYWEGYYEDAIEEFDRVLKVYPDFEDASLRKKWSMEMIEKKKEKAEKKKGWRGWFISLFSRKSKEL